MSSKKELEKRIERLERRVEGISTSSYEDNKVAGKCFGYYKRKDEHTLMMWEDLLEKKMYDYARQTINEQEYLAVQEKERELQDELGGPSAVVAELLISEIDEQIPGTNDFRKRQVHKMLMDRYSFACREYIRGNISKEECRVQIQKGLEERKGNIIPYIILKENLLPES